MKTSRGLGVKVWIARHFKLFGDCLQFFKKADEPAPLGEVHFFHVVKVEALAGKKKTGRFDVVYRTSAEEELQCLSMMAAHDEECLEWVNIINKLLRKFKNNMEAKGISSPSVGPASPVGYRSLTLRLLFSLFDLFSRFVSPNTVFVREVVSVGSYSGCECDGLDSLHCNSNINLDHLLITF